MFAAVSFFLVLLPFFHFRDRGTGEQCLRRISAARRVEPRDAPEGQGPPNADHYPGLPCNELELQRWRATDAADPAGVPSCRQ